MNDARLPIVLAVGLLLNLAGCAGPHAVHTHASPMRADPYAGVHERFAHGAFFKPRERDGLPFQTQMAPLIVQRVTHRDTLPDADRFGALDANGLVHVDAPTVYYATSTAILQGRSFQQIAFVWFYPETRADTGGGVQVCGVRMTLGADGSPLAWEGPRHVYVSQRLEDAASDEFGPPSPGRKYAIERVHAIGGHATVVVPRVLSDGPVPMGPFVYLRTPSHSISTLLCRCMPSQVDAFVETAYYDLLLAEDLGARVALFSGMWPDDPTWLERCLRFPDPEDIE